jgi:chaperonin GroES
MSEKKKKSDLMMSAQHSDLMDQEMHPLMHRKSNESKRVRKISPLGFRVLVSIQKDSNQTEGGLYLPEGAKQNMQESLLAEVLEVASAIDDSTDEETNVSGIPLGALVLIPKNAGTKIPWDDTLRIVETKEVLAIVNEISVT